MKAAWLARVGQMAVHAVVTGVQATADEPLPERGVARVQRRVPVAVPAEQVGVLLEALREPLLAEAVPDGRIRGVGLADEPGRRVEVLLLAPVDRDLGLGHLARLRWFLCSHSSTFTGDPSEAINARTTLAERPPGRRLTGSRRPATIAADHHDQGHRGQQPTGRPATGTSAGPPVLPPFREVLEGGLELVGEQQLAGDRLVVGGHPHRHRPDRVGAADGAAQLGQDAVGAEAGGDDPGVEDVRNGAQMHHRAVVAPPRGGRGHRRSRLARLAIRLRLSMPMAANGPWWLGR